MKKHKTIRHLEQKAQKGDLAALFQLYEHYLSGQYVELNHKQAEHYLGQYTQRLKSSKLRIKALSLTDFRIFSQLDFTFESQLTVLIGDNGAGKTTIADGIAKVLSWLIGDIEKKGNNGKRVVHSDINVNDAYCAEILTDLSLTEKDIFRVSLARTVEGAANKKDSYLEEIRLLANLYRVSNANETINLPTFAYYSVERSDTKASDSLNLENVASHAKMSRFNAYKGALDGSGKFVDFLKWFVELDNLANTERSHEQTPLSAEIKLLEKLIADAYPNGQPPPTDPIWQSLQHKRTEHQKQQTHDNKAPNKDEARFFGRQLDMVKVAIENLVPHVSNLHIDRTTGKALLKVNNLGNTVNINQLSQGQKTMVVLAADLARRLVMLNPCSKTPLSGQGIVIIDEIELHLHPQWQQTILPDLQKTFPGIQFIVTTHSPQVLSTVDVKSIRKLVTDEDGNRVITYPRFQTKGVTSADVLSSVHPET